MPSLRQHRLKRSYVNAKIQRFAKLYLEMRYVLRLRCNSQGLYYELRKRRPRLLLQTLVRARQSWDTKEISWAKFVGHEVILFLHILNAY